MASTLLISTGLAVLSFALCKFENRLLKKLGGAMWLFTSSYIAFKVSGGNYWWGLAGAFSWFFLPLLEILLRIRQLHLPLENRMRHRHPPHLDLFPELPELSRELEESDFVKVDDLGCDWDGTNHFLRVFYHENLKQRAVINFMETSNNAFYYVSISSETLDKRHFMTWNFPFAYSMSFPPDVKVQRADIVQSFSELAERHQWFLLREGVKETDTIAIAPDDLRQVIEEEVGAQVSHNLRQGLIERVNEKQFRYSWKGCLYLWFQFVKDMIRM